jgi:NADH-quinone oxidoreductase subunit J
MEYTKILFYIFASWAILASLLTVFARNAARAALFLVWAFFSFASLWILIEAEFLATILILVYVGAVMVLFLFVIKMLNIDKSTLRAKFAGYLPLGIVISVVVVVQMAALFTLPQFDISKQNHPEDYSNITELAMKLYTEYAFAFELAAIILLIAIIASIALVHTESKNRKEQKIDEQIEVDAQDRLRVMKG